MKYNLKKEPSKIEFLLPKSKSSRNDRAEISIVVPALNEELTIGEFVDWCWEGLKKAKVKGEIIIVDSSSDDTPNIALAKGAKVLRTPKRGLGQAYLDAIPYIRGNFIILGDCDLTYDFRKIKDFIDSYRSGNDFVMGSRFKGSIQDGAMPRLHRYFGTPLTTWILNQIYKSNYTDIHCGMRGLTKAALIKIDLTSRGWEYASEMVLKAARYQLKIAEVPVIFYRDRDGRLSHHRRLGFWSPWYAGLVNLKVMLVFSPDSFLIKPGVIGILLGIVIVFLSLPNNVSIGGVGFSLHSFLMGISLAVVGYSMLSIGLIARLVHGYRNGIEIYIFKDKFFKYGMSSALAMFAIGFFLEFIYLTEFIKKVPQSNGYSNSAILGFLFIVFSIQTFSLTLIIELIKKLKSKK
jgi:glycosyltransferase involved in cell wall biosynthesis